MFFILEKEIFREDRLFFETYENISNKGYFEKWDNIILRHNYFNFSLKNNAENLLPFVFTKITFANEKYTKTFYDQKLKTNFLVFDNGQKTLKSALFSTNKKELDILSKINNLIYVYAMIDRLSTIKKNLIDDKFADCLDDIKEEFLHDTFIEYPYLNNSFTIKTGIFSKEDILIYYYSELLQMLNNNKPSRDIIDKVKDNIEITKSEPFEKRIINIMLNHYIA